MGIFFAQADNFYNNNSVIRVRLSEIGRDKNISVGLYKALVITFPDDIVDVLVSDPKKADVVTRSSRMIYLFGKEVGQASVFVFGANGKELLNMNVKIERDIGNLEANLRRFIPDSNISTEIVSDNIVLHGTVRTIQDSQKAVDLANAFIKGGEATTQTASAGQSLSLQEDRRVSTVVNLLDIEGEDQVTLKITVAEVRREILKQIGFTNSLTRSASSLGHKLSSFSALGLTEGSSGQQETLINIGGVAGHYSLESALRALEQARVIRTLAEPTLTAVSGQSASFRSGGERLYPTVDKNGTTNFQTREFGVLLNFTPTVLAPGRISLRIQTEVSEPVTPNAIATASTPPEFRTRRTETTVELPSGGSIALAGLIKSETQHGTLGVPVLSQIPILGALFRNKSLDRNETETVIIATPYLVKPVSRNSLSRPDDNFTLESDPTSFFLNRVHKVYRSGMDIPKAQRPYQGTIGFIYK
ncbi:Type II/IV secretion system secretin RcpA/CpaC, Flp pilus assembly [Liberibacter crescens BT-1]|uniref:Type II/IV secretion system secretin RcpA/CpaC, Flp pilus assembly n=1 Tax=Liberibacter crescens (strain BT-1) TaxID=1215343 RepID=L0EY16_LIBCB|nr:Type II/IV secretion system secretin RcpA/CpaC, Flp pilus assembly [Liberibacter crescens BT-1]AMC13424.1 pilus assembly protein CpaC [Liberibacter crescens]